MAISIRDIPNQVQEEKFVMKEVVYEYNQKVCPECNSTNIYKDHHKTETICLSCGIVIEENIMDLGREWNSYDHDQAMKRIRVGAPTTFSVHDKGLTTTIDRNDRDANGRAVSSRSTWRRIRRQNSQSRISGPREHNLAYALGQLDRYSSILSIPRSIREEASIIYRHALDENLIRGRTIEGVVAASLYAACRKGNLPRTLVEVVEATPVGKKELGKTYRFLNRKLKINLRPTSPKDYIPRFASNLELSGKVEAKAIEIIDGAIEKKMLSGKGPTGVAAAALYIASILLGEKKTQKEIADAAGVTEVTIRNRYTELTEQLEMGTIF